MAGRPTARIFGPRSIRQGYAVGMVVAKHHSKTLRVCVKRRLTNNKYNHTYTRRSILVVHDELNEAAIGDLVIIKQSRPHSKTKFFEVHDIAIRNPSVTYLENNPDIKDEISSYKKPVIKEETSLLKKSTPEEE